MTEHVLQSEIERLALNDLPTSDWARVRRHLFQCDSCLRRLIDAETPRAATAPAAKPRAAAARAYVY